MNPIDKIKEQKILGLVEDLILDNTKIINISPELKAEIENLPDLICLSLNTTHLQSLTNFPNLPSLIRLELINNKFPPSDLKNILNCPSLQSLSLSNNTIQKIEDLKILEKMEDLIQLDLEETELSKRDTYRKEVFGVFKNLKILDNKDFEGNFFEYNSGDSEEEKSDAESGEEKSEKIGDESSDGSDYEGDEEEEDEESEVEDYESEGDDEVDLKKLKSN